VKGLVELHGGEVIITSRVGIGTSVDIRLPVDCETMRPTEPVSNVERLPVPQHPDAAEMVAAPADMRVKKRA
jgi:hypothetical protein